MKSTTESATRRRFLRQSGVLIALPVMESLLPRSMAAAATRKPVKRVVVLSNNYGVYPEAFFPAKTGADYDLSDTLKALERHRKDFNVYSNLDHGINAGHSGVPTLLSGVQVHQAVHFPEGNMSMDQKIVEHLGTTTRFPSLTLQVNETNLLSITRTGVQVPSMDIGAAYKAMFTDQDATEKEAIRGRFARHGSILDAVLEEAKSIEKKMGRQDQEKFAQYLDSVRGLEKKIVQEEPWLDRPKPVPGVPQPPQGQGTEKDLKAMMELIALAIQTDSTRAITMVSGFANGDFGLSGGYHGFSHHGQREFEIGALKKIEGYQVSMMAYLIDLLKAQADPINGGTLFDHTMILYGCGMATGEHSTKNLPLVLAGGGFKLGEHKGFPVDKDTRVPAANLLLSMLQNFGLEIDRFGTSTGTLTGLEVA